MRPCAPQQPAIPLRPGRAWAPLAVVVLLSGCQLAETVPTTPAPSRTSPASSPAPTRTATAGPTARPTPAATPLPTDRSRLTGTVRWVIDGDTFDLRSADGRTHRVRMLGIDSPELTSASAPAQCGAATAKKTLQRLLPAGTRTVVLFDSRADDHDRFGRTLGYVRAGTTDDVALRLLRAGMVAAWAPASSRRPSRLAAYEAAERRARIRERGLWATCSSVGR